MTQANTGERESCEMMAFTPSCERGAAAPNVENEYSSPHNTTAKAVDCFARHRLSFSARLAKLGAVRPRGGFTSSLPYRVIPRMKHLDIPGSETTRRKETKHAEARRERSEQNT